MLSFLSLFSVRCLKINRRILSPPTPIFQVFKNKSSCTPKLTLTSKILDAVDKVEKSNISTNFSHDVEIIYFIFVSYFSFS